ncbi:diaminopimelate decarboxylase [Bacillota bacterium]
MISEIRNGILHIDGCSTKDLADKYGTPLYVMSEKAIVERIDQLKDSFLNKYANTRVAYAAKAFCTVAMLKLCNREGIGVDVVSGGELYTAIKSGFPPELIEFNGNNKLDAEIEMAVGYGIGRIIIDGLDELPRIEECCRKHGKKMNVLFRITPGVGADSHDYIITGKKDSKFGIPLDEKVIFPQVEMAIRSKHVNFLGFHFHIGSQIFENEAYLMSLDVLLDLVEEVKKRLGFDVKELNFGGGFGAAYTEEKRKPYSYYIKPIMDKLNGFYEGRGLDRPAVVIEPGRSIVAEAGLTLYTIGSIKIIEGVRKYVSIDGGMTDNIRPALYSAEYSGIVATRADAPKTDPVAIAGKCCESGDVLIRNIRIAENTRAGDLFAIFSTGAYGYSMASNYNRIPIPAAVMVKDGKSQLIVQRQTYEHMVANDI